ncbi:hypothetical protein [Nonomuraea sp. NPDC002799]
MRHPEEASLKRDGDRGPAGELRWRMPAGGGDLVVEVHPWVLMRTTGLPVRLLDGLGHPDLRRLTERLLAAQRRLAADRRRFERSAAALRESVLGLPPEQRAVARRCLRTVRAGAPLSGDEIRLLESLGLGEWVRRWQCAVVAAGSARAAARSAHAAAWLVARRKVAEAYDDEAVRHGAFLADPGFYQAIVRHPLARRPGDGTARRSRLLTATAHRHLRRLAATCGNAAGPVLYARLDPESPAALHVGEPGGARVAVEAGDWLSERLRVALDRGTPEPELRVWPSPVYREPPLHGWAPMLEHVPDGVRVRVSEPALSLWRAVCGAGGGRTVAELGAELGLGPETVAGHVRELGVAVVVSRHRLAAAEPRPLTALALAAGPRPLTAAGPRPLGAAGLTPLTDLAAVGPRSLGGLSPALVGVARLAGLRDRYAAAPWPERARWFEEAGRVAEELGGRLGRQERGQAPEAGQIFDERRTSPYSERVTIGGAALARLRAALTAVLPLCSLAALLAREDARDAVRAALGGRPGSLARLAAADLHTGTPVRTRALGEIFAGLVSEAAAHGQDVVRLRSRDVAAATAGLWARAGERLDPCMPGPGLMAAGADLATATWVLSELHHDCGFLYAGLESGLHSAPDLLWDAYVERAARLVPREGAATVVRPRSASRPAPEPPGLSIEAGGWSVKPREQVVPVAQVRVPARGDAVDVRGRRMRLHPGDVSTEAYRAVSLPALAPVLVDLGARTPRVMIDDVVYQRARWRLPLPAERGADAFDRWLAVHRLRGEHGLPRHVFVRHPAESRPFYVDFCDPLAVEDLARREPAEVIVTEMLPAPDASWWRVDGEGQCAELRLGCFVRGEPADGG